MNALRTYLSLLSIIALAHLLSGCGDDSSGPTGGRSGDPAVCQDDQDEPGDTDQNDSEDDDGDEGEDCDDD